LEYPAGISKDDVVAIMTKKIQTLSEDCAVLEKKISNEAYKVARLEQWKADYELLNKKQNEIRKLREFSDPVGGLQKDV
jgi:hypothetical protein